MEFEDFKQIINRYRDSSGSIRCISSEEDKIVFEVLVGEQGNVAQELNVFINESDPIIVMASPIGPCPADYNMLLKVLLEESTMTISELYLYMPEKGKIYLARRLCFPLPLLTSDIIHFAFQQIPDQAYKAKEILGFV